jgi:WhiB family redox-sensing transcriptional regulator
MPINITTRIDDTSHRIDDALSWQESALCAQTGPEFFFPAPGSSTREAKRLCGVCEGREACLAYALEHDERFGVWGGLSEKERQRLRREGN